MRLILNFLCSPSTPSIVLRLTLDAVTLFPSPEPTQPSKTWASVGPCPQAGVRPTARTWSAARMEETAPVGEIGSIYGEYPKINPSVLPYQALYK